MNARLCMFLPAILLASVLSARSSTGREKPSPKTKNVVLIIADGFRWQDMFGGIDSDMLTTGNKVTNPALLEREFGGANAEERRQKLMPFIWEHVASKGQLYGNRHKGSIAHVSNKRWFSYPGYNEVITGFADDTSITTNNKFPNPHRSVFEWLNSEDKLDGRVAAFGAWDVFPYIFNTRRCGFPVDGGDRPFSPPGGVSEAMELINSIRETTPYRWPSAAFDSLVYPMCVEYVKKEKPRALFLALGETDEWAHERDYARYIAAAHQTDKWIRQLWDLMQSMPQYRDKTTFIFTTDHGRGDRHQMGMNSRVEEWLRRIWDISEPLPDGFEEAVAATSGDRARYDAAWSSHSADFAGSDEVFMAVWGPDTPALGEVEGGPVVLQGQAAATLAAALGYDYSSEEPRAAPPLLESIVTPKTETNNER